MKKEYRALSILLSILFVIATTSISHGGNKNIPDTDKNIQNLKKEYPALVKSWQEAKTTVAEIKKAERVFGVPDRAIAEKRKRKLTTTYNTQKTKFNSQFATCKKKLSGEISKSKKKLASLEKKKKLTPSMEKRKDELEKDISRLSGMLNKAEDMNHPFPVYHHTDEIQRLQIKAGEVARKKVIAYAPNLVKYRMSIQDNITDIKKIQKMDKSKITSADKQKLAKSKLQLKANYKKATTKASLKKKPLSTELAKLEKKVESIKAKTEKAEKAKRSTDKLDHDRLLLIGEISNLNYQLDLINKMVDIPEIESLTAKPRK